MQIECVTRIRNVISYSFADDQNKNRAVSMNFQSTD